MKKISLLASLIFLASCSYIGQKEPDIVRLDSVYSRRLEGQRYKNQREFNGEFDKKQNSEILNDERLYSKVFDRTNRKVNKNLKGVWVATVLNLDFPKTTDAKSQMREIDDIVYNTKKLGLNAIFLQVKPVNDSFYNSKNLPWSKYLTGVEGSYPGYDPLEYFIKKAHENNIELHAWINPYRVSMNTRIDELSLNNAARRNPDWVFEYAGKLYFNPANKEVVKYLSNNIEEIVKNYDVDGIHLDDYFYPYPNGKNKLPEFDYKEYKMYAKEGQSLADFRRENVNDLIKNLSVSVHKIRPDISFGISPFGIWRNIKDDIRGSRTNGLSTYDDLYADVLKWMENSWIDYVAPQIYWEIGNEKADYKTLVNWWNEKARQTNTPLYIGEGIYKANSWSSNEIRNHKNILDRQSNVNGYIFFRYDVLNNNRWIIDEMR